MRPRALAVIGISTLVIVGAISFQLRGQLVHFVGADRVAPGSAPRQVGVAWACPAGWIAAYGSGNVYYPTYHPSPPSSAIRPARCYRADREAKLAGYRPAPAPMGGTVLDGIYLVPASNQVKANCQAAATELGTVIPCPTLLPMELAKSLCTPSTLCTERGVFFTPIDFTTPIDYPGAAYGHAVGVGFLQLILTAMPLSSQAGQAINSCSRGNFGPLVMERQTLWATCRSPSGLSFTWLTWEIGATLYAVSASAETVPAQRLAQYFSSTLIAVSPAGS